MIVRCYDFHENVEVKVYSDTLLQDVIFKIKNFLDLQKEDYQIFYKGSVLLAEKSIGYYDIEDKDFLVLIRSYYNKNIFFYNMKSSINKIETAKQWLYENIIGKKDEIRLTYLKMEENETFIQYECEDMTYNLKLTDGKIDEYDVSEKS